MDAIAAHELWPEHAVDVLRQAGATVLERLPTQRRRQDGTQEDRADEEDRRACHQEDAQERDGAVNRPRAGDPWCYLRLHLSPQGRYRFARRRT